MANKGRYRCVNREKYDGDASKITYRSGLELKMMRYFDLHKDVEQWGSETVIVPYRSPVDNKMHRYFTDFWAKIKDADGNVTCLLIEVKPLAQCKEPVNKTKNGKKPSRRFLNEARTWAVNKAKWQAARAYADSRGWRFIIMTEKQINGLGDL